jgi:hypothetical protein
MFPRAIHRLASLGLLTIVGLSALSWSSLARARVQHSAGYTKSQTFNGALRFLRVDHGYKVTEKDADNGYLMFEYTTSSAEPSIGSVEVIEQEEGVLFVVQLPKMPEHHERYLAEGLLAKLRSDYGEPPERRKPPEKGKAKADEDAPDEKPDDEPGSERKKDGDDSSPKKRADERVPGYRIK